MSYSPIGSVKKIFTARRLTDPMRALGSEETVENGGLRGDYHGDSYLTLVEYDMIPIGRNYRDVRRHIIFGGGISLDDLVDRTFTVGDATLRYLGPCNGGDHLPGAVEDLRKVGGIRARVILAHPICVGDKIRLLD